MISAFTDCNSESIVIRVPYEMIVEILWLLPDSPESLSEADPGSVFLFP